ncbi:response regulator [Ornithinimicrobium sp. LYQ103]|uniref:response regulator n=1 Tax=Ornithinimicrobium sp. LYQ103 TaxID=3378796 RepID=UPI003851E336
MTVRVVIVDDHSMFRDGLRFALERTSDLTVVGEAVDGATALAKIRATEPDVVMMDLAMPGMGGLEAISQLTAVQGREDSHAAPRVLVLTLSDDDASIFAAVRAGAHGYLVKGASADEVASAVRAVADGHAVFGSGTAARMLAYFAGQPSRTGERFPSLSEREREVLERLAEGESNPAIGAALFISPITVRNHVSSILAKLQVSNRREAMLRYRQP